MSATARQIAQLLARVRENGDAIDELRAAILEKASWVRGSRNGETIAVVFELTEALTALVGDTATADITVSSNTTSYPVASEITVYNTGEFASPVGTIGCAIQVPVTGGSPQWWVVHVQEPASLVSFTFTGGTHAYTSPADYKTLTAYSTPQTITYSGLTAVEEYPHSFLPSSPTITNPNNLYAVSGDTGYAIWDADAAEYVLSEVRNEYARKIVFKLETDWPVGLDKTQTDATALMPFSNETGPVPTTFTLRDRYNRAHNARAWQHANRPADVGVAVFNYSTLEYDIIECSHRATNVFGYLDSGFTSTAAEFDVVTTDGEQDGSDPSNGTTTVTVKNAYSWETGTAGHNIEIVRDAQTGFWRPRQMRCPT